MPTRLTELELDEMSGVASPANELPGFMVMKSKAETLSPEDRAAVLKEVDRMESDFAVLYSALNSTSQYIGEAPEEVQAAHAALLAYVETLFNEESTEEPPADPVAPEPVVASKDGRTLLEKLMRKPPKTEEKPVVAKNDPDPKDPAEVEKATPKKDDPVTKETEDNGTEIAKALGEVAESLKTIAEVQKSHGESIDAVRDALSSTLDRVSDLEVQKQASDYDITPATTVDKSADAAARGEAALRSVLVRVASQPGHRETIG